MKFILRSLPLFLIAMLVLQPLMAQDSLPSNSPDPDLPQPFDGTVLDALIQNPPFTRSVNPSDSLILTGLAYVGGKPVVTVLDTATKESIAVSEKPNSKGWVLQSAPILSDVTRAIAQVSIGGEVISLRYNKDELESDKNKGAPQAGSPGGSGSGERYERGRSGPSKEDMERYQALSEAAKQKLRDTFSQNRERLMKATPEERAAFMRSTFDRIQREDQGGKR